LVISPPPRFAAPNPLAAEGYWSEKYVPCSLVHDGLADAWADKGVFLAAIATIERAICLGDASDIQDQGIDNNLASVIPGASFASMDGFSPSRIDGSSVGSGEFCDMCCDRQAYLGTGVGAGENGKGRVQWPEGYAAHYIGKYNVVPTRRFFDYVIWRSKAAAKKAL
jgi:hypothetical protein